MFYALAFFCIFAKKKDMNMKIVKDNVTYSVDDNHVLSISDKRTFIEGMQVSGIPTPILEDVWETLHKKRDKSKKQ